MNAGIYVRISTDRPEETSTSTQEQRCREYATSRGWHIAEVYIDRGRSAFKTNGKRPALDRLMADVESGIIDVVVVWKLDRWSRSAADWYRLWDRLTRAGCEWASVTDSFDTTTAMGEAMVGVAVVFARLESAIKSERITEWHHHRSATGAPPNGPTVFGYRKAKDGRLIVVPSEAKLIVAAARRMLDEGATVRSVVRSWNEQGILTRRGKPWAHSVFINFMRRPTLIGCRVIDGSLVEGDWRPILDRDTRQRLVAFFSQPGRRVGRDNQSTMLTGIIHCGICGHRMQPRNHHGGRRYSCKAPYGEEDGPCGRLSIKVSLADEYLRTALITAVADGLPAVETHDPEEVNRLEAELSDLASDYGNGLITRPQWVAARAGLDNRLNEAIARASRATAAVPANLEAAWPSLTVEQKRLIVLTLIEKVTVAPSYGKADRISITWRV